MCELSMLDLIDGRPWHETLLPGSRFTLDNHLVIKATITPAAADTLLETRNQHNRRIRPKQVDRIAKEIRDGTFLFTGDTIVFDCDGKLRNGQHRLLACKLAEIPITTLVVIGVDSNAYIAMDQHARRGFYDALDAEHESDSKTLAAAIGQLLRFFATGMFGDRTDMMCTNQERVAILAKMPEIRDSVQFVKSLRIKSMGKCGLSAALHFVFAKVNDKLSSLFWKSFATSSIPSDPSWDQLRDVKRKLDSDSKRRTMPPVQRAAYFICAWNSILQGEKKVKVQFNDKKPFPKVHGWSYHNGKPISPRTIMLQPEPEEQRIEFCSPSEEDED